MLKINSKEFLEGYRFILVGICSVSIDFIFYYLFIYLNLFDPNTSKKISFIIGALFAFYANRNYVFHVSEKKKSHFILFCLLYLVSFILNALVHDYVYSIIEISLLSFICATGISTIVNYLGQKFVIFKKKLI